MRDNAEIRRFVKSYGDKVRFAQTKLDMFDDFYAKLDMFDDFYGDPDSLKRKDAAQRARIARELEDAQHDAHVALLAFRHGMYPARGDGPFEDLADAIKDAGYDFHTRTFSK